MVRIDSIFEWDVLKFIIFFLELLKVFVGIIIVVLFLIMNGVVLLSFCLILWIFGVVLLEFRIRGMFD